MKRLFLKDIESALGRFKEDTLFSSGSAVLTPLSVSGAVTWEAGDEFTGFQSGGQESIGSIYYDGDNDEFQLTTYGHEPLLGRTPGAQLIHHLYSINASDTRFNGDLPDVTDAYGTMPLLIDETTRHLSVRLLDVPENRWKYAVGGDIDALAIGQLVLCCHDDSGRIPVMSVQTTINQVVEGGVAGTVTEVGYSIQGYWDEGNDIQDMLSNSYRTLPSPFMKWANENYLEESPMVEGVYVPGAMDAIGVVSLQYSSVIGLIVTASRVDGSAYVVYQLTPEEFNTTFDSRFSIVIGRYQAHFVTDLTHHDGVSPDIELATGMEIFISDALDFIEAGGVLPDTYTDLLTVEGPSVAAVLADRVDNRVVEFPEDATHLVGYLEKDSLAPSYDYFPHEGFEIHQSVIIYTDGSGEIHSAQ